MTTLAAILTLMPLALAWGQGAGIQQPLAIAIIAGLTLQYPLVLLVMPTLIGPPPVIGQRPGSLTVLTGPANLAGLPALALPVPVPADTDWPAGLPASLQIIGPAGNEEQILGLGRVIEEALS